MWICSEHLFSISRVSIYYGIQSDIRVKSYCRLNLLKASVFNFKHHDILRDTIGHPSKTLLSLEFAKSLCFQFSSVSIYYGTQSDIRVKSYYGLNLLGAIIFNLEHLDILRDSIGHPSKKLLSFEFAMSFCFQFRASRYITGCIRISE